MLRHFLPSAFAVAVVALSSNLAQAQTMMSDAALPLNARPGECYARVYTAPQFRTTTDTVIKKAASERINVIPERYDWTEETVMTKPASERIAQVIPAEYRWEEDQVLVKPAAERIEEVPATYKTVSQTELVKAATTEWKRGRGPVEKVDNLTGDIMCLVEVPAEYRTITRSEVDQPASTRRVTIPAEYQTVRRQVLVKDAEVRKETVPAQYQTVKVRKLVEAAREERIAIPAEYQTVTRQEKVSDGHMVWSQVLCETNATRETVFALQNALKGAGYAPGKIDGTLGTGTADAVRRYQKANGLAEGGITLEVLQRLGVSWSRPSAPNAGTY